MSIPTHLFRPQRGVMTARLFENANLDLPLTLFYDITIPLEPFESGLAYEEQPVSTSINLDFLQLPVADWRALDGRSFELGPYDADASIYLGGAHNPIEVQRLSFQRSGNLFQLDCRLFCDFEFEGVADSVMLELRAEVLFEGLVLATELVGDPPEAIEEARELAAARVAQEAYAPDPLVTEYALIFPPRSGDAAA